MASVGYVDPVSQAGMVLDDVRTSAFAEAIARVVTPEDVVLDVGSGSGVLALLAARAGARRVYAVEQTAMALVIEENARANDLQDRVQVLRTSLEDLSADALPERPTVIVSEMLGHFAPDEHAHRLFRLAKRLAAPEPKMIPRSYRVTFALARVHELDRELAYLEDCHGVRLAGLVERLRSRPAVRLVKSEDLLSAEVPGDLIPIDAPLPSVFEGRPVASVEGEANAVVVAFDAELAPDVTLSTRAAHPQTHWRQMVFPLHPALPVKPEEEVQVTLEPRVVTMRGTWRWTAETGRARSGGDAMQSLTGSASMTDIAAELGLRLKQEDSIRRTPQLSAFEAILRGGLEGQTTDSLAERLLSAQPERFTSRDDARQEVLALLRHARAL